MKVFKKYKAIAMHVQRNYTYCYRMSLGYKVILVLEPNISLRTHICARFNVM